MADMIKASIEHLAAAEDTCGTAGLAEHFEAIRKALYEQLGRALFDAEQQ